MKSTQAGNDQVLSSSSHPRHDELEHVGFAMPLSTVPPVKVLLAEEHRSFSTHVTPNLFNKVRAANIPTPNLTPFLHFLSFTFHDVGHEFSVFTTVFRSAHVARRDDTYTDAQRDRGIGERQTKREKRDKQSYIIVII